MNKWTQLLPFIQARSDDPALSIQRCQILPDEKPPGSPIFIVLTIYSMLSVWQLDSNQQSRGYEFQS